MALTSSTDIISLLTIRRRATPPLYINNVSVIYASTDGCLWVGLSKGLCRYDYHNNSFVRYAFPENLRPRVNAIFGMSPTEYGKINNKT